MAGRIDQIQLIHIAVVGFGRIDLRERRGCLARAALAGSRDDEIIARLTQVRGIGRWTVEMLLLFDLGRPDVWPVDDYGVRKGFAKTFGKRKLPTPKQLMKIGEKWRPYRSIAAWYFWRALDKPEKTNRLAMRAASCVVP